MSILDELEDFAEGTTFGYRPISTGMARMKKPTGEFCGRGHPRNDENLYRRRKNGRLWLVCRACARITSAERVEKRFTTKG